MLGWVSGFRVYSIVFSAYSLGRHEGFSAYSGLVLRFRTDCVLFGSLGFEADSGLVLFGLRSSAGLSGSRLILASFSGLAPCERTMQSTLPFRETPNPRSLAFIRVVII